VSTLVVDIVVTTLARSRLTLTIEYEQYPPSLLLVTILFPLPGSAAKMSDDEFGSDIEFTQELEDVLTAAETQPDNVHVSEPKPDIEEIEDLIRQSPMEEFRKKGYLSVSDLVGTVWCEVQVRSCDCRRVRADS